MCGRFALLVTGAEVADFFGLKTAPEPLPPRYNIAPTQPILALRHAAHETQWEFALFRWGLVPSWAKDVKMGARMINARSETVTEKPAFRAAFKRRRCLIPASGFFEWQKVNGRKQPMYIHPKDSELFALAGLWEFWAGADGSELETCTILTTTPNDLMAPIHDRMPVIVAPEDFAIWLDPGPRPENGLHLLRPYPAEKMVAYPVSNLVNSPANDTPACIAPLAQPHA